MEQDRNPPEAFEEKIHSSCRFLCSYAFLQGMQGTEYLLPKFTVGTGQGVCVFDLSVGFYYHQLHGDFFFLKKNYKSTLKTKNLLLLVLYFFFLVSPFIVGLGGKGKGPDSRSLAGPGDHQGLTLGLGAPLSILGFNLRVPFYLSGKVPPLALARCDHVR